MVTYSKFFHKWSWTDEIGARPPQSVADLISSQVSLRTNGRIFLYQGTQVLSSRNSTSIYQRASEANIQAIDPVSLTLIALGVATVLGLLYQGLKGAPLETGIDIFGVKWYAKTKGHKVEGDQGKQVDVQDPRDVGGGAGGGGDNQQTQGGGSFLYIAAAIAGLFILFIILK